MCVHFRVENSRACVLTSAPSELTELPIRAWLGLSNQRPTKHTII